MVGGVPANRAGQQIVLHLRFRGDTIFPPQIRFSSGDKQVQEMTGPASLGSAPCPQALKSLVVAFMAGAAWLLAILALTNGPLCSAVQWIEGEGQWVGVRAR